MEKLKNNRFVLTICNIEKQYKIAFFSVIIFGVLAHGMALFNKFSVHDDVIGTYYLGATFSSGRWMLGLLSELEYIVWGNGSFSMPLFNGIVSISLTAVSVCLIVKLFDVKRTWACIAVSGVMISIPAITSMFGFMFTAPAYSFALLLSTSGSFLVCYYRKWYCYFIGLSLIACSLGIYQSYISFAFSVMIVFFIKTVFENENNGKKSWIVFLKTALYLGSALALSLIVYLLINYAFVRILSIELDSYAGINSMGQQSIFEYLSRVAYAYFSFFNPQDSLNVASRDLNSSNMYPVSIIKVYYLLLAVIVLLSIILIVKAFQKSVAKGLQLLILIPIVPLAVNSVYVICEKSVVYSLMMYAQVMLFVFLSYLIEHVNIEKVTVKRWAYNTGIVLLLALSVMYIRFDNVAYLKMNLYQQRAIGYFTTLSTQIKSTEGYRDEYPVAVINEFHINDSSISDDERMESVSITPYRNMENLINNYAWKEFMAKWVGYKPKYVDSAVFERKQEVMKMPSYPDDGSIKIIDNTVVIKF